MGIGTLGFIKGFTSTQLSSMDKREEFQREKDKLDILEKLRREGERIAAQRNFDNEDQKVNDNLTQYDYDKGTVTFFNGKRVELHTRVMTEAEKKEYKDKQIMGDLTLEGKRLDNSLSAERARTERAQQANYYDSIKKRGLDSASSAGGSTSDAEIAKELMFQYKDAVDEAVKSNNISLGAVHSGAIELVRNSRNGEEARRNFLTFLNNYRTGRKATDQQRRAQETSTILSMGR